MEMAFGVFGLMGFVFALAAYSKVDKLEKELVERGILERNSD